MNTQNKDLSFPPDFLSIIKKRKTEVLFRYIYFFTSEDGSDDSRKQASSINGQIKDGKESVSLFFL